jgi:hypothetical protein
MNSAPLPTAPLQDETLERRQTETVPDPQLQIIFWECNSQTSQVRDTGAFIDCLKENLFPAGLGNYQLEFTRSWIHGRAFLKF